MPSPLELDRAFSTARERVGTALDLAAWPEIPVRWNRRLRRAGRALIQCTGRRFDQAIVELSPAYFEVYPDDLEGILIHEMVHVGLAIRGLPFGHGPEFRRACLAARGQLHGRSLPGRVLRYRCPVCETIVERRRRLAGDRWCAPCAAAAEGQRGVNPYAPERALVLIGTGFQRAEASAPRP